MTTDDEIKQLKAENEALKSRLMRIDTYRLRRLELEGHELLDVATPIAASLRTVSCMLDMVQSYLGDDVRMALEAWNHNFKLSMEIKKLRNALQYYADWGAVSAYIDDEIYDDRGDKARASLKEGE